MSTLIQQRVDQCQAGTNPTAICRVPSGWVVLSDRQFLPGYCILLPDPIPPDLNALDRAARESFLYDMTMLGDALLEVTRAFRINYEILGNLDPALHAHVLPRYLHEPDEYRRGPAFLYPQEFQTSRPFDPVRDAGLMAEIAASIQRRLA